MIRKLSSALAGESVLLLGLTATILVALNVPSKWQDVVQAAVPLILALAVRQVVSSPATVAAVAVESAVDTARELHHEAAGQVGEVTQEGLAVAGNAAGNVLKRVGGLVSALVPSDKKQLAEGEV